MRKLIDLLSRAATPHVAEISGHIDFVSDRQIRGWACDRRDADKALDVEILIDGAVIKRLSADVYRADLQQAGMGNGRHGFTFDLDQPAGPGTSLSARVKGTFWPLIDDTPEWQRARSTYQNSMLRGKPALTGGPSAAKPGEADVAVAAEMQALWRTIGKGVDDPAPAGERNMWSFLVERGHGEFVTLLQSSSPAALAQYCVDVQKKDLAHGLMQGKQAYTDFSNTSPGGLLQGLVPFQDALVSMAVYLGVLREECPEQGPLGELMRLPQDLLRAKVEDFLGFSIVPPTIFDGLFGLTFDDGGVLHNRDVQALYTALRSVDASGIARPHICEIGGGFGRAGYFAMLLGVERYTLVDIPTVAFMQYFSLRRSLPKVRVSIVAPGGTMPTEPGVSIVLAGHFDDHPDTRFDLVVNCDSFPEMGDGICGDYLKAIRLRSPFLLSLNQEAHQPLMPGFGPKQSVVAELALRQGFKRRYRFRNWVRKGYVEELFASA